METLDALLPRNTSERKTLADIIFSKLEEHEAEQAAVHKIAQGPGHASGERFNLKLTNICH